MKQQHTPVSYPQPVWMTMHDFHRKRLRLHLYLMASLRAGSCSEIHVPLAKLQKQVGERSKPCLPAVFLRSLTEPCSCSFTIPTYSTFILLFDNNNKKEKKTLIMWLNVLIFYRSWIILNYYECSYSWSGLHKA